MTDRLRDPALTAPPPEEEPAQPPPDPFGPAAGGLLAGAGLGVQSVDDLIAALPREEEVPPKANPIREGLGAPTSLLNVGKAPNIQKLRADRRRIRADEKFRVEGTPDFDTLADLSGRSTSEIETIGDIVLESAGDDDQYRTGDTTSDRVFAAETALKRWEEGTRRGVLPSASSLDLEGLGRVARLENEFNRQGVGPDWNVDYHTRVVEPVFNDDGTTTLRFAVEGNQNTPEGRSVLNPRGLVEQAVSDLLTSAVSIPTPPDDLPPRMRERVNSSTLALAEETGFSPAQVGAVLGCLAGQPSWPEDLAAATHGLLDLSGQYEKGSEDHAQAAQRVFRAGRWAQEMWDILPDQLRRAEPGGPFGQGPRGLKRPDWEEAYAYWSQQVTFDLNTEGESVVRNVLAAVLPAPIISQLGKGHVPAAPNSEALVSDQTDTEQAVRLADNAQSEQTDIDRLLQPDVSLNPEDVAELLGQVLSGDVTEAAQEAAEAASRILSEIVKQEPSRAKPEPKALADAARGVVAWASTPLSTVADLSDEPAEGYGGSGITVEEVDGLKRVWADMPNLLLRHATPYWADRNQMRSMLPNRPRRTDSFERPLKNGTATPGNRVVLRPNNASQHVGRAGNTITVELDGNPIDFVRAITEIAPFVTTTESASSHVGTPGKGTLDEATLRAANDAQVLDDVVKGVDWAVVPSGLGFDGVPVEQSVGGESQDAVLVTGVQFSTIMNKADSPILTSRGLLDPDGTILPATPDDAEFGEAARTAADHVRFGDMAFRWPIDRTLGDDASDWDDLPVPAQKPNRRQVVVIDLGGEYVNASPEQAAELWTVAEADPAVRSLTARVHGDVWQPPGTEQVWATTDTDPAGNLIDTYHRTEGQEDPHSEPVFVPTYEAALLDDSGPVGPISGEQFREGLSVFEDTRSVNGVSIVGDFEFGEGKNPWKGAGTEWAVTVDVPTVMQGQAEPGPGSVAVTLNGSGAVKKVAGVPRDIAAAKSVFDAVGIPISANPKVEPIEDAEPLLSTLPVS